MTITFIIPAYNAARYLRDCLNSIYSLDTKECGKEVIVVNDGSTDDTALLLEQYRNDGHEALVVITQENKGLSAARNAAMDIATGDYICFVDADDILSPCKMTEVTVHMQQSIDVIGIEMRERDFRGRTYPYRRYVPPYGKVYQPAKLFLKDRNLMPCAPAYLYRREMLEEKGLRFVLGIYHEDEEFTPRTIAMADSFVATDTPLYLRLLRHGSITTTTDPKKQERKLRDMLVVAERLEKMHVEEMRCKIDYLTVDTLRLLIRERHSREFKREVIRIMKEAGHFPMRWRWEWKYILFNIFTRLYTMTLF